ncbi:MAG TPA: beta-galactosidase, partial [Dongiaceae bacterium]
RGGPILMVQVENEYGSFGSDKAYLTAIRKMIEDAGIEITRYTADGSSASMLAGGTFPDLPSVINFGGAPQPEFENFAKFRQGVPLMCGEYWVGWFDSWGEKHHTGDNKVHLAGIEWMLERNIGFNLYMVHGGTSWGFMNGANFHKAYEPEISSYDYDSPIDEAGRLAPKFALYRDAIARHLAPGETLPAPPTPLPVIEIPRFEFKEHAPLLGFLGKPVKADHPLTFEDLHQDYGFVLYRAAPRKVANASLEIREVRDFAVVMEGSRTLGTLDRRRQESKLEIALHGTNPLDILVENMGRINFGPRLVDDRKGIVGRASLDGAEVTGWEMYGLPLKDIGGLNFSAAPAA